jgi:predicted regulator of Ras-like GTPase activity (Roadblock/LC7/MglB family)
MNLVLGKQRLDRIHEVLSEDLIEIGVNSAILLDMSGNVIAALDDGACMIDVFSLAALAAGNFGAVNAMARLLGEEEFTLLFHKGDREHIHFSKMGENYLLVTIFDTRLSLGYLRLKTAEAAEKLSDFLAS